MNASFDLFLQTHDPYYAGTAWQYFQGMRANARVANGYTILNDVTTTPMVQGDLFPAYGFAENFKYLYLIFANTPRFDRAQLLPLHRGQGPARNAAGAVAGQPTGAASSSLRSAPRTTSGSVVDQNGGREARRKLP